MRSTHRAASMMHVFAIVLAGVSCSGSESETPTTPGEPPPTEHLSVTVTPQSVTLSVGKTGQLAAVVTDQNNQPTAHQVAWRSVDPAVASVSQGGQLVGLAAGTTRVIASVGVRADTASVVVRPAQNAVWITPEVVSVALGDSVQLAAAKTSSGATLSGVTWSTSDPSVATVSTKGVVLPKGVGDATLTATVNGDQGLATVRVVANPVKTVTVTPANSSIFPGDTKQLTATLLDDNRRVLTGRAIAWTSSNAAVASVSPDGLVTGVAKGSAIITAVSEKKRASASVQVLAPSVAIVSVSLAASTLAPGQVTQSTATLLDGDGNLLTGKITAWQSSNPAVATVTSSGVVKAIALGPATIRAISDGTIGGATLTVGTRTPTSLAIVPDSVSVVVGQSTTLAAEVRDGAGVEMTGRTITWSSSNASVASVSNAGVVTTKAIGTSTITAAADGMTSTASISVTAVQVATVAVTPSPVSMTAGDTIRLTATAKDAGGAVLKNRITTWSSSNLAIATVGSAGEVVAKAAGTASITANVDGRLSSATVTVTAAPPPAPAPVASITVTLSLSSVGVGQSSQASVTLRDAAGNVLTGRPVAWSSNDLQMATVSGSGLITPLAPGSVTIVATSEGQTGAATLTINPVAPAPVASVTLTANATSLTVGQSTQTTVVLRDAAGQVLAGRMISWTSTNSAIAAVSVTGAITAFSVGTATITASSGGVSGSVTITVTAPLPTAVASVTVALSSTVINVGQTTTATATAYDASNNVVTGRQVSWSVGSGSLVATISGNGLLTAVGEGITAVTATIDGISGFATLSVVAPPPPPPPPPTGTISALAQLPRVYLDTRVVAPTGATIVVKAGGNLQTAINSALPGDEILVQAGASFVGPFTLPNKSGSGWITIRTSTPDAQLPAPGQRVTAAHAPLMPKLISNGANQSVIYTAPGASQYRFIGIEVTAASSVTDLNALIRLGDAATDQSGTMPTDLILDRMYIHGNSTLSLQRCVLLNSARSAVIDSHLSDCHADGFDSQAIVGWNGAGPYKIVNNYLSGAGETMMFGGANPATIGLVPSDIEIRGNHFYKPASWKGSRWTIKNLLELKNAQRVLIEGNIFDGNWRHAQTGNTFVFKSSGSAPLTVTQDVTVRLNRIRNVGSGIGILGKEAGALQAARRITITDNIMENVNTPTYDGDGRLTSIMGGVSDVIIEHNTFVSVGSIANAVVFDQAPSALNLTYRNNIVAKGSYGVKASGVTEGTVSLNTNTVGWLFTHNVLLGSGGTYPTVTHFSSMGSVGFTSTTDYRLSSGSFRSAGTDGRDLGANVAAINSATAAVIVP